MTKPWANDPIVEAPQGNGISAVPLPRNPSEVRREQREEYRTERDFGVDRGDREFDNATKFRNEFRSLPSVTNYNIALGTYNSALKTKPTPEGDQSLITAFARMMDPNSVVREGEFATAAGNESAFKRLEATIKKELGLDGAGRLTDEGRARLREEMRNLVVNRFQMPYEQDRTQYSRMAQMEGIDPFMVVGEAPEKAFPANLLDPPSVEENFSAADPNGNTAVEELPQEYQDAHYAYLQQNWGNVDADDYVRFRSRLDEIHGLTPDPEAYRSAAPNFNTAAAQSQSPADLGAVPSPDREMGMIEGGLNWAAQSRGGAFAANMGNAGTGGLLAEMTGNRDRLEEIRAINPGYSAAGELGGGITGAWMGGKVLGGVGKVLAPGTRAGSILANPTTANVAYGTTYGATQDTENRFRGGVIGGTSALGGDIAGQAIGKTFPRIFNRGGINEVEGAVPSVEDLQATASRQYNEAQAAGQIAEPDSTAQLIEAANAIAASNGRAGPTGNIYGAGPFSDAMRMVRDYDGLPMTPTQADATRKAIGEGRMAMNGTKPDLAQRMASGQLLDAFDEWAQPIMPGVENARATAQRAILGREMQGAQDIAEARSSMFSQSGEENALRNSFRNLDLAEVRGRNSYPPELSQAIRDVSRGTPASNLARDAGKMAPTGVVPLGVALGGSSVGTSIAGPIGAVAGPVMLGTGLFGRKLATSLTRNNARQAELVARGGPEYVEARKIALDEAARRAALWGAGLSVPLASLPTREEY